MSKEIIISISYFVFYQGSTDNPIGFVEYYKTHHSKYLMKFPGLQELRIHENLDWQDGQDVSKGEFLLIAEMCFPNIETMEKAISSPERQRAREDFNNFPDFQGNIWHQAMATKRPI